MRVTSTLHSCLYSKFSAILDFKLLLLAILALSSIAIQAQQGVIRGFVYEESSGEPVIYTNVIIEGEALGAATDDNGFFSITNVPIGEYNVLVTNIEYDTFSTPVSVANNKIINLKLFLVKSNIQLKTVTIASKTQEKFEEVRISTIAVTPKQISRLPSVGGEPDLAQYLQVLPGVIFTGDQGGQLYIRGGAPIHNKVLLDGMVIYNPFHSIGLFSVFETDIIRNVEVLTGGFNAEYGDRISAIIDITTRDGNKTGIHGKVSASPFLAKALIEGPIKKLNPSGGSSSFIFTGKHSYLNRTSPTIYDYVNDGNGIPFTFTDLYGKLSFSSGSGSKFSLFGFSYQDSARISDLASFEWNSFGFGTNFVVVPGASNLLIEGIFAYSKYENIFQQTNEDPRFSEINGFQLGTDFTYFIPDGELKYGFEIVGFETDFSFFNALGVEFQQQDFTSQLSAFVKYRKVLNRKLVIEPSVRIQYYSSLGEFSPEPRLGLKYNLVDRVRLKFAGGLYSQNLISTKSDRDVVNLFNGFLSGPDETLQNPERTKDSHRLQKAWHAIGGIEIDASDNIEVTVEPYYKKFTQLININREKLFPSDPDFATERGDAYGIDLLFKYEYKRMYAWLSYSLSWVTRDDGTQVYPPHYDRRHNANAILSYAAGKDRNIELSARWNLGSGFPFTQTSGFYEAVNFLGGIGTDYTNVNGDLGILYNDAELNGGRLPYYHRLDLSAKYTAYFTQDRKLEVTASVTNTYNRENIFYFDRVEAERVNQLPILPSLSASFSF